VDFRVENKNPRIAENSFFFCFTVKHLPFGQALTDCNVVPSQLRTTSFPKFISL